MIVARTKKNGTPTYLLFLSNSNTNWFHFNLIANGESSFDTSLVKVIQSLQVSTHITFCLHARCMMYVLLTLVWSKLYSLQVSTHITFCSHARYMMLCTMQLLLKDTISQKLLRRKVNLKIYVSVKELFMIQWRF